MCRNRREISVQWDQRIRKWNKGSEKKSIKNEVIAERWNVPKACSSKATRQPLNSIKEEDLNDREDAIYHQRATYRNRKTHDSQLANFAGVKIGIEHKPTAKQYKCHKAFWSN